MGYPNRELIVVPEGIDENDNPTTWAIEMQGSYRKHYIWIEKAYGAEEYEVIDSYGNNLTNGKIYKTLRGAKKAAEVIAWEQEKTGYFTN